jgi:hypothetical protein
MHPQKQRAIPIRRPALKTPPFAFGPTAGLQRRSFVGLTTDEVSKPDAGDAG